MRAVLVDDEELARFELRRLLRSHPEVEVIGEARDGEEALQLIRACSPDVVFLDIQMPVMTGFDLLEKVDCEMPEVIFTTAYDQHALRAFEVNALDYLLKPIAPNRLREALRRLASRQPAENRSRLFVRDGERCWIVRMADILLLESEGNYTRVFFASGRPLLRKSLNAMEMQLDQRCFVRANRRQIVNLDWIEASRLCSDGGVSVTLSGGGEVRFSRRRTESLKARLRL